MRNARRHLIGLPWSDRSGFTLTEALILTAIILVFLAILIPVLQAGRENSRRSTCISNLKRIGVALHLYADSSDGWFPSAPSSANTCSDADMPRHTHHEEDEWLRPFSRGVYDLFIPEFLGDGTVMFCPSEKDLEAARANTPCTFALSGMFVFPAYDKKAHPNDPLPGYALEDLVGSYSILTNNPTYDQQANRMVQTTADEPTSIIAGELSGGTQMLWFTKTHDGWLDNASCNHWAERRGKNYRLDVQHELLLTGNVQSKTHTDLIYEAFFNPASGSEYRHYY